MNFSIDIPTRIHLSLIDLSENGYRKNGGLGFAVDGFDLAIHASEYSSTKVRDSRSIPFMGHEIARISESMDQYRLKQGYRRGVQIEITGSVPTHCGFGTSTAVRLACLEALDLQNERSLDRQKLVLASGRGGTSGVGINTYFDGGFVMDLGCSWSRRDAMPSSQREKRTELPTILARHAMPSWGLAACVPRANISLTEAEEISFFNRTCPIELKSVKNACYDSVFGVCASVISSDFNLFNRAVVSLQRSKMKQAERAIYGGYIENVESILFEANASCVALSSLGPGLVFFSDHIDETRVAAESLTPQCHFVRLSVRNTGRKILYG